MDRRTFVALVAGTYLLEPLADCAQQAGKVYRIGLLAPYTEPAPGGRITRSRLVVQRQVQVDSWSRPNSGGHTAP
jgi:hypothetical protein